jgi:hypothetical protein
VTSRIVAPRSNGCYVHNNDVIVAADELHRVSLQRTLSFFVDSIPMDANPFDRLRYHGVIEEIQRAGYHAKTDLHGLTAMVCWRMSYAEYAYFNRVRLKASQTIGAAMIMDATLLSFPESLNDEESR